MISQIFRLETYTPSLAAAVAGAIGLLVISVGAWVRNLDPRNRENREYALVAILIGVIVLMLAPSFSTKNLDVVNFWDAAGWVLTILVPVAAFAFETTHLDLPRLRRFVPLILAVALGFVALVPSGLFVDAGNVRTYPWGPYQQFTYGGYVFIAFFWAVLLPLHFVHFRRWHDASLPLAKRRQYRLTFFALVVGFLGSLDFLAYVGVPWPPTSLLFFLAWIFLYAYAISRYRLFQVTPALAADAILESMPDAVFVADTTGEILIVNPNASRLTLASENETRGRRIGEFLPIADEVLKDVSGFHPIGPLLWQKEADLVDFEGGKHPVAVSSMAVRHESGATQGYIFIAVSIDQLKNQMNVIETQKAELMRAMKGMVDIQEKLVQREIRMIQIKKEIDRLKTARADI